MKKTIKITQSQLRNLITEVVSNLQEQHKVLSFQEVNGYAKISKADTGLDIDIFIPLKKNINAILMRNGYNSEKEYIPITIDENPKILHGDVEKNVSYSHIFPILDLVANNIQLINALKRHQINIDYFKRHLDKNVNISTVNPSGKKSKLPKEYRIEDPEETMEYMLIWPKDSGLKVDVFADDGGSFLRNNHQLVLLARNGYDNVKEFIPILVSNRPEIVDKDIKVNISHAELIQIFEFVKINRKLLIAVAKCKISGSDFSQYMKKVTLKEDLLKEYRTLSMDETGLPTDIWVDEGGTFQGHAPRIKFQASKEQRLTKQFSSMLITDPSHIENFPKNPSVNRRDVARIQEFVGNNRDLLLRLARKEIDYEHGFAPYVRY